MADVHCPQSKGIRPMKDCMTCGHHIENGSSLEWCGYRATAAPRTEIPINALRLQFEDKIRIAESLYMKGRTKIADNYVYEARGIYQEIRRRENEKRTS